MGVATIGRRPRWTPPAHARIDWSHPLASGFLVGWIAPNTQPISGSPIHLPLITSTNVASGGITTVGSGSWDGVATDGSNPRTASSAALSDALLTNCAITVLYRKTGTNVASSGPGLYMSGSDTTNNPRRCGTYIPYSDGTVYFDFGNVAGSGVGAAVQLSAAGASFGEWDWWTFQRGAGIGMEIWRNGTRLAADNTKNGIRPSGQSFPFSVNGWVTSVALPADTNSATAVAFIHKNHFSAAAIASLHADPFQFLVW